MLGKDLLGEDLLVREAIFVDGNRIELSRRWGPGPIACMIGCNPANADAHKEDRTSNWWINWCRHYGFGGFRAVNLYSFVTADPSECRRRAAWFETDDWAARDALNFVNLPHVVAVAKAADQVFVCWGAIAWDHQWIDHVVENIQTGVEPYPDLWCWGLTKAGAPMHPMARGKHRLDPIQQPILWRAA